VSAVQGPGFSAKIRRDIRVVLSAAPARRAVELDYLAARADAVPLGRWRKIVDRAVEDAERGDPKARRWLAEHLLGRQAEGLTTLGRQPSWPERWTRR
jgi:uncharacterized protein YfaS (alpha-2-macroglobulin family)